MNRVLLIHQPVDGGVARHIADLVASLPARGMEVVVAGPGMPAAILAGSAADVPVTHELLGMSRAVAPRDDVRAVRVLSSIVRRVRPDLIHAHSSKAGAIARIIRTLHPRLPVLYTPHGYAMNGFFERAAERVAYREVERVLAVVTSRVIAVCEAEARLARLVTPSNRVRVVHNGIAPAGDGPSDERVRALRERGPVVCTVSQLRPGKGLETLLAAWSVLVEAHPGAQLAVVGGGELAPSLAAQARAAGIAGSVHWLGEHSDPLSALRAADVFVLPSWAEAFPYAVLEAMSLGIPVVASAVGGIGEALVDRASGLLVPPRQPHALAAALTEVVSDSRLGRRLGTAARQRVLREFNRDAMADGIARIYDEVLDR